MAPHRLRPGVKHTQACFSGVNMVNASICALLQAVTCRRAFFSLKATKTFPVERFSAYSVAHGLCLRFTLHNRVITHRLVVKVRFVFSVALWMQDFTMAQNS